MWLVSLPEVEYLRCCGREKNTSFMVDAGYPIGIVSAVIIHVHTFQGTLSINLKDILNYTTKYCEVKLSLPINQGLYNTCQH
jgi:hypothetical protein